MKETRTDYVTIRVTPTLKRLLKDDAAVHRWTLSDTAYYRLEESYEHQRRANELAQA